MAIERAAARIGRWRRRPRFRAPVAAIVLPLLLAAGLLLSLTSKPTPKPTPPLAPPPPASRLPDPPAPPPAVAPPTPPPVETAETGCPHGCAEPPPGCVIKGNISWRRGEKIYHLPGGEYYDRTEISPRLGEAWFCTEEEARENGWRKSKR